MNFRANIEAMRQNFISKKPRKDVLKWQPSWTCNHIMNAQYEEQFALINSGTVYYGALVQANVNIFRFGFSNQGAVLVYSTDPYFDTNPQELANIAHRLFSHKYDTNPPSEIKNLIELIADEYQYFLNLKIPFSYTNDRVVYFTTLIIHRHHLPERKLTYGIFPIIAKPDELKSCIILPSHYWTKEFIKNFQ